MDTRKFLGFFGGLICVAWAIASFAFYQTSPGRQTKANATAAARTAANIDFSAVKSAQLAASKSDVAISAQASKVQRFVDAEEDFAIDVVRRFYLEGKRQGISFGTKYWTGAGPAEGWTETTLEQSNEDEFAVVKTCSPTESCYRTGRVWLPNVGELTLEIEFDGKDEADPPVSEEPISCTFKFNEMAAETVNFPCHDVLDPSKVDSIRTALMQYLIKAASMN